MSILRRYQLVCLLFALAAVVPVNANAAEGDAIIEQVRADWMERFEATQTFVYHAKGQMIIPAGKSFFPGDPDLPEEYKKTGYPLEDEFIPYERTWSVDKASSLIRLDVHESVFAVEEFRRIERWKVEAYDGETLWTGEPDSAEQVTLQPASRAIWFFAISDLPVFLAHGLIPLGGLTYADLSRDTVKSISLEYVGTAVVAGRECQIVDCRDVGDDNTVYRLYVDLSRQSAVLRCEKRYFKGVRKHGSRDFNDTSPRWLVGVRLDIEYQKQSGFWIPKSWKKNGYDTLNAEIMADGGLKLPELREAIFFDEVTATINEPLDAAIFGQPLESGTIVRDRRAEKSKTFQVAEDGETLVPVSRVRGGAASQGWTWNYILAAIGILCLSLAGYSLFRKSPKTNA